MFYRLNDEGNAVLFHEDGHVVTRLDADVYPVGSSCSARYGRTGGIVLTVADAQALAIPPEDPPVLTRAEEQQVIDEAVKKFPHVFGLRAFPGDKFKLMRTQCYVSEGVVQLYTYIWDKKRRGWFAFAKGTARELERELVPWKEDDHA